MIIHVNYHNRILTNSGANTLCFSLRLDRGYENHSDYIRYPEYITGRGWELFHVMLCRDVI